MQLIELDASIQDMVKFDSDGTKILTYLSIMLPPMLELYHEIEFNHALFKKIDKTTYNNYLTDFIDQLDELKCTRTKKLKTLFKYGPALLTNDDIYQELNDVLQVNKPKFKKLNRESVTEINKMIAIYNADDLSDNMVKNISLLSRYLPDIRVRNLLKSITGLTTDETANNYKNNLTAYNKVLMRIFKTTTPSDEQVERLKRSPVRYKEYRKALNDNKKLAKQVVENEFDNNGYDVVDVKVAGTLLKKLGIPNPIDVGFKGKVALSTSPTVLFNYYTSFGKELENIPGSDIKMNPDYTKEDNTYYCTGFPQVNINNNKYHFYTKDYRRRSLKTKYEKAAKLATSLDITKLRKQYTKDFEPILSKELSTKAIAALVTAVLDDTAGRIGNTGESETNGVYGIHNLLTKFITIKDGKATLSYNGKKNVHQRHVITDAKIVKALTILKNMRKANQYIFSVKGDTPVSTTYINKYLTSLGFPDTAHGFRKFHANRIFTDITSNRGKKDAIKTFNTAVEEVAKKLGHNPSNSIKSYIDSDLMKDYFDKTGAEPPKPVKRVFELMNK